MATLERSGSSDLDALFEESIVIDGLGGDVVPSRLSQLTAGMTAINATVASPHASFRETIKAFYTLWTFIDALPDKLVPVQTSRDIKSAKEQGKLGILFGLQDGASLEGDLTLLSILHRLGLRVMTLTYNERNQLGDGCVEPHDLGITCFGQQVVRELNRLGIVLDLTHVSQKTSLDAMEITSKPPIFSHSNPYSLTPSRRCITDEQLKAMAELGGVVGISVWTPMVDSHPDKQPTLDDYLDRIDYVAEKFGIDHVGIGSDIFEGKNPILWRATTKRRYPEVVGRFEHHTLHVEGFEAHGDVRSVPNGLRSRGYSDEDIKKVLGLNFLRVFEATMG